MFYTYELVDPRDGAVFYIGKGKGNRLNQHERDARRGKRGRKCDLLRDIIDCGFDPIARVTGLFKCEKDAYSAEVDLIANGPDTLLNISVGGYGGRYRFPKAEDVTDLARRTLQSMAAKIEYVEQAAKAGQRILLGEYDITEACRLAIDTLRKQAAISKIEAV